MEVIRITPLVGEGEAKNHLDGCDGSDYTLCGMDTAGDCGTSQKIEPVKGVVTCMACIKIVNYCKSIKPW